MLSTGRDKYWQRGGRNQGRTVGRGTGQELGGAQGARSRRPGAGGSVHHGGLGHTARVQPGHGGLQSHVPKHGGGMCADINGNIDMASDQPTVLMSPLCISSSGKDSPNI